MRISFAIATLLLSPSALHAVDKVDLKRIDAANVLLTWEDSDKVEVYLVDQPDAPLDKAALVASDEGNGSIAVIVPTDKRKYFRIKDHGDQSITTVAERLLQLEQGSNFRDVGGYEGAGGKKVRWGKIYRSGALPMLNQKDYTLLGGLDITSIIDLRSLEEREVAATELDDRTGALFLSNDYSLKPLMRNFGAGNGENVYVGMEKMLKPQYRAIFARLLANDGAVMYHCSAGQDRTGIASALVLSALGVNRDTILKDYHLSTPSRRPQWELPLLNPADHPGNPIVQYYAEAAKKPGGAVAEPLYSKSGVSHLVQFFAYIDKEYGSVEGYLTKELGVGPAEILTLQSLYLEP